MLKYASQFDIIEGLETLNNATATIPDTTNTSTTTTNTTQQTPKTDVVPANDDTTKDANNTNTNKPLPAKLSTATTTAAALTPAVYSYRSYDSDDSGGVPSTKNTSNVLMLSQQNVGNIEYLKQQSDTANQTSVGFQKQLSDMVGSMSDLSAKVDGLVQAQQSYAATTLPSTPLAVTGT